ncbi:DUF2514 family protein [Pseudomonas palmensis]|uniref:DUF2514 family protein n=1 Tax=Pseudomonas palmensis TaxID=2815362 RepID=UPI001AE716F4|nr:DUF2514 family protein [Pseudomonas palmensis]
MTWLRLAPAWVWWLGIAIAVGAFQQLRVLGAEGDAMNARKSLADYRLEVAERDRRSAVRDRAEEQRRQLVADEEGENAEREKKALQGKLFAAESAAGGLRGEINRLRAGHSATCDTIATQQRQAGATAVVVLGGLLEDADRMAGSCAAALERSRIAGLACESIMDGTRTPR